MEWYRRRAEAERKEWWWQQRTRGLIRQVQQESEGSDLEHLVAEMDSVEGRTRMRARLAKALPVEQRRPR